MTTAQPPRRAEDRDPYWSRHRDREGTTARRDPIIWGSRAEAASRGPLGERELRSFEENGFLILDSLFSEEEVERLLRRAEVLAAQPPDPRALVREPGSDAVRSIFRVHRDDRAFGDLAEEPRLAGVARQILDSEVAVHQSRINFKPGFTGRPFDWHSDFETWHMEDGMPGMRALSASLLLTDNLPVNGTLMLVPGSHRTYVRCQGETPEDHHLQSLAEQRVGIPSRHVLRDLIGEGGVVQATGGPGSVLFFDCNTLHGSAGNITPYPRHNVFMVFNSEHNRLEPPFGGTRPRPAFLADRGSGGDRA